MNAAKEHRAVNGNRNSVIKLYLLLKVARGLELGPKKFVSIRPSLAALHAAVLPLTNNPKNRGTNTEKDF